MQVLLQHNWFAPNGSRYRKNIIPPGVTVPDEFRDQLPPTAKEYKGEALNAPLAEQSEEVVETLHAHDGERAAAEAEGEALERAALEEQKNTVSRDTVVGGRGRRQRATK